MPGEITVEIKRQLFDPPFVLQIGGEQIPTRIGRLDEGSVVARIDGRGTYRIDIAGVGFWFAERKAEPYEPGRFLPEIRGGILERMAAAVAGALGRHCGAVAGEFREIRSFLFRRGR